jgi:ABC-type multidrug transport system fused ATPase/permease subunit
LTIKNRQEPNIKKNKPVSPVTKRSLFFWAFSGNLKLQIILLVVIIFIVFSRVVPLEMQKRIVNDAIALRNLSSLILYCGIYLLAVTTTSLLKLAINYLQALIGERAMVAMRKDLYHHILTMPLSFFRTTQPGMVVSSLMTELSAAGTFSGQAFAVPVTNVLTLLAFAGYLFSLHPELAGATLLIYPVAVFVVPLLQKRANKANKKRVDLSRETSSQIAESISGIQEVQIHGAYEQENYKFDTLVEELKKTRIRWSIFRFGIKTTNNFFVSLGPFVVFIFGGYLVMRGELALGAMVAFLSAQEKLYDPWKELIEFYQTYQDASIRYTRTMEYFDTPPEFPLEIPATTTEKFNNEIEVTDLVFETSDGHKLLKGVSFSLDAGEHLAIVGFSGSGKSTLVQCIGKMYQYTRGSITIGGREVSSLSKAEIIENIGYISQNPFIFTGSIKENLLYAHQATHPPLIIDQDDVLPDEKEEPDLDRMILVLQQAGLFVDVMRFGLDSLINPHDQKMIDTIIRIRKMFKDQFGESLHDYVEFFDQRDYHFNSSVAENIIFGTATDQKFGYQLLPENAKFRNFLQTSELLQPLLKLGVELAEQAVDILGGVGTVDIFFENSPVPADKLEECQHVLTHLKKKELSSLPTKEQIFLLTLALNFTPAIHTMTPLRENIKSKILSARDSFPLWCDKVAPGLFLFYEEKSYIHDQSILNNILFGKTKSDLAHAQEKINQAVVHMLIEEECLEEIASIGMHFQVGSTGDRLSGGQRQKLAIARVLIKQPSVIIMDEATSALDNKSQTRIQRLMETRWKQKRTVIAIIHRLDTIHTFDKVAVMKTGRLVEWGTYPELIDKRGILYELIHGKK